MGGAAGLLPKEEFRLMGPLRKSAGPEPLGNSSKAEEGQGICMSDPVFKKNARFTSTVILDVSRF